jgi:hypothetical protein
MPGKRLRQAACVLAFGALALDTTPLRASEVTVVLTKVDDGDAKHVHNGTVIPGRVRRQILRLLRTRTQHRHVQMVSLERIWRQASRLLPGANNFSTVLTFRSMGMRAKPPV